MKPIAVWLVLPLLSCAGTAAPRHPTAADSIASLVENPCAGLELPLEAGVTEPKPSRLVSPVTPETLDGPLFACVHVSIDETGEVVDVEVVRSNNSIYANSVRRAFARFRFEPATREGVPVAVRKHFRSSVQVFIMPSAALTRPPV